MHQSSAVGLPKISPVMGMAMKRSRIAPQGPVGTCMFMFMGPI